MTRVKDVFLTMCVCGLLMVTWNINHMHKCSQRFVRQHIEGGLFEMQNITITNVTSRNTGAPLNSSETKFNTSTSQQEIFTAIPPTFVNINPAINEFFTIKENKSKDEFINLHQYNFSMNSNICIKRNLFLLIVVHSAPINIKKRTNIRSTYGSIREYKGKKLGVVFMLGSVYIPLLQEKLNKESKMFGDIVQGNFHDSYRNLSRKHIMCMHWYVHHCSSEFILKVDDDTFVNPFRLIETLKNESTNEMVLRCQVIAGDPPYRKPRTKWYTSVEQYPFPVFPPFCLGFAYITTSRVWKALYEASEDRKMMDMDDVFVSVVLSLKANVGKVGLKNVLTCSRNLKLEGQIESSDFVLDRPGLCRDRPFKMWSYIMSKMEFRGGKLKVPDKTDVKR